jgi:cell division septation protein DedD
MRLLRAILIAGLAVGSTVWAAPVANAGCHAFTVSASSPVTEGGSTTVTVTRDAAVADSSITVSTVDGTAKAGSDYAGTQRRIDFTGSSTSQAFTIATANDSAVEPAESFTLVMSNPGGCAVNPNFDFDDTASVTINDNDVAPTAPPTTIRTTTTTPRVTTTTGGATTTVSSSTTTTEPEATTTTEPVDSDDDGSSVALLLAALAVVGAGVAGTIYAMRRRQQG